MKQIDVKSLEYIDLLMLADEVIKELEIRKKAAEQRIDKLENARFDDNRNEYKFEFEELRLKKAGTPYVARFYYDINKDCFEREFKELEKTSNRKEILVSGEYTAREGDILDIRDKRDRLYYIVVSGELKRICQATDVISFDQIKKYLKGDISKEEFLEYISEKDMKNKKTEIKVEIIDELRDED